MASDVRSLSADNPFSNGEASRSASSSRAKQADVMSDEASSIGDGESRKKKLVAGSSRRKSMDDATSSSFSSAGQEKAFDKKSISDKSFDRDTASSQRPLAARVTSPEQAAAVHNRYAGAFAPNPSFIRLLRFLLYGLVSLSALVTAGLAISVVQYYNAHDPSIKPSWGSLIALIVFGIITPGSYFGTFLVTPRLFRYGTFAGIVNQVRTELVLLFSMCVIWVSGALAMANDLRGYENCIWDGYYHYPADFHHVCDLINATVILGYVTFGLVTLTFVVVTAIVAYILLYLDQEVLSELTNDLGGRAYRARTYALALQQARYAAGPYSEKGDRTNYSEKMSHRRAQSVAGTQTARPYSGSQAVPEESSRRIPSEMAYHRPSSVSDRSDRSDDGPMMVRSEREQAAWNRDMREA